MQKLIVFLASCCLLGVRVSADPIIFNITSLSGSAGSDGYYLTSGSGYSNDGDSITIGIGGGIIRPENGGVYPGAPITISSFGLDCYSIYNPPSSCLEGAFATIGGRTYSLTLGGESFVSAAPNNLTFEPPVLAYTVAGTVMGSYTGVCDGTEPFCAAGTVIADIEIDLPGIVTASYAPATFPFPGYTFEGDSFVSTPEPAAVGLLLLGLAVSSIVAVVRRGRNPDW